MSESVAPTADEITSETAAVEPVAASEPEQQTTFEAPADYPSQSLAEVMGQAFSAVDDEPPTAGVVAETQPADPIQPPAAATPSTTETPTTPANPASNATTGDGIVTAEQQAAAAGLRDLIRQRGYDPSKWQSDDAALDGLLSLARKLSARDEDAEFGRRLKPFQAQFEDFIANQYAGAGQQVAPQAPQAQPQQPAAWFNPPPVPENWRELVERDEEGGIKIRDGVRPDVARQIEDHLDYHRAWQTKLQTNPTEALRPLYEQAVADAEERAVQRVIAQQAQQQQQQAAQSFIQQNREWMFARNEKGEFLRDPSTGSFVGSPEGKFFYNELQTLVRAGVEEQTAQQLALRNTQLAVANARQQTQQPQTPAAGIPATQPAVPQLPTSPTQRPVPPGLGGGRANTGLRQSTPQSQYGDAHSAFADAFKDISDEQVREIILS